MTPRPNLRLVTTDTMHDETDTTGTPGRAPRTLSSLDRVTVGLLALVLTLLPIFGGGFATPQNGTGGDMSLPLLLGLSGAAFLLNLWREVKRPVAVGGVPGLGGALLLFGVWAGLSCFRSPAPYLSVNAYCVLLACLLIGGLVSRLGRDPKGLLALLSAIIAGGTLTGLLGIVEYFGAFAEGDPAFRVFAGFVNPNFLAGYLLLTIPVTLGLFTAVQRREVAGGLAACLAAQSACLLLTGSRAGLGVLLAALGVWTLLLAFSGAGRGKWNRAGIGVAAVVFAAVAASAPTRARVSSPSGSATTAQAAASGQSHSGAFRRYTWMGTTRMAKANALFGAGLGSYEVTYPRYAETAFTAHAHNSFLQLMAEIGFPGALLLVTALAAATAFSARVLVTQREWWTAGKRGAGTLPHTPDYSDFVNGSVILCGLIAALFASLAHSLLDSDWYVLATAATLSAVVGLAVAQARDLAPLATHRAAPLAPGLAIGGLLVSLFILGRAGMVSRSRSALSAGERLQSPQDVLASLRSAAASDPLNPEPHLQSALLLAQNNPETAEREIKEALRVADTGRVNYRLGQFYARREDYARAVESFSAARVREPRNVQNLRQLAEALRKAGREEEARNTLHDLTVLETTPYGKVRALPEIPEMEFAHAHAALGDMARDASRWPEAADEYGRALTLLREYWPIRRGNMALSFFTQDKRHALSDLYEHTLTEAGKIARRPDIGPPGRAAELAKELITVQSERRDDEAKEAAAQTPAP